MCVCRHDRPPCSSRLGGAQDPKEEEEEERGVGGREGKEKAGVCVCVPQAAKVFPGWSKVWQLSGSLTACCICQYEAWRRGERRRRGGKRGGEGEGRRKGGGEGDVCLVSCVGYSTSVAQRAVAAYPTLVLLREQSRPTQSCPVAVPAHSEFSQEVVAAAR